MKKHILKLIVSSVAVLAAAMSYASGTIPHQSVEICTGDHTTLTASTTGDTYEWTPATGLSSTTTKTVTASPTAVQTYNYTCKVTKKGGSTDTDNLISLGGFEFAPNQVNNNKRAQNKMGDWIDYEYLNFDQNGVNIAQGAVTTARNANNVKTAYFYNTAPHTGNYMLVADGGNSSNARVWSARNLKLKSGVTYQFSVWAANIDIEYAKHGTASLAKLKFVIENQDGTRELSSFTVKETLGQWNEFKATFVATKNYDWCHIYLVNYNTVFEGNDFALDDIYFGAEIKTDDDVTTETFPVVVKNCTAPPVEHNETVCQNHSLTLTPTNTGTYLWDDGSTNQTLTITPITAGDITHTCQVTVAGLTAPVTETFNVKVNPTLKTSISATVQKGEPYTENGFNISGDQTSQAGVFSYTLNTQSKVTHCDSIVSLTLHVESDDPHHYETVCVGDEVTLTPETSGISYLWSDGSTSQTLTITPTSEGTENYTCVVTTSNTGIGNNLIQNSSFEDVSTACPYNGFTTDFICFQVDEDFPTSMQDARGWLRVAHIPFAASSITPHSGDYLLDIDGQDNGVTVVPFYKATITGTFKKDETYKFTYWANTICVTGQAEIAVNYTINGQTHQLIPKTKMVEGGWKQYGTNYELTIPEDCSEITISMVDEYQNWLNNDLALDDFEFRRTNMPITTTEHFEVEAKECHLDPIYHNKITCQNSPITLTTDTEGLSYEWSDGTQVVGTERSLTIDAATAGKFTYTCNVVKSKDGTTQKDLIVNGGFEDISTECPYPGIGSDYDCYGVDETLPTTTVNGSYRISTAAWTSGPHGGTYCFLADGSTNTTLTHALDVVTTEGLKKDKTYKLTFWATNTSFKNTPILSLLLGGPGPIVTIGTPFELNNDNEWHEYTFDVIPTYNYSSNRISFIDNVHEQDGNLFAIDDISLICTSLEPGLTQEEIFNVTVSPIKYGTVKDYVCQGSAYNKDGFSVTAEETEAGGTITKTKTVESVITHCDSIVTLTLIVNPILYGRTTDRVCQGSAYNKDGFTVTADETEAGGTITKTKTIPSVVTGCDSIVTLTLNVDPRLYGRVEDQICSGKSYNKNGFVVTEEETAEIGTITKTKTIPSVVTGCDSIVTLTLTVNPNPEFEVETKGRTATVDVSVGTAPFKYQIDGKVYDNAVIEGMTIGDHAILVTDANTCASTGNFSIIPVPVEPMVFFTPNNDGINDRWLIKGLEYYPTAVVQIYDRYHKLLYSAKAIDFDGWDGTYNGHPMPMTDYWYVIINEEMDKMMSGHFILKR